MYENTNHGYCEVRQKQNLTLLLQNVLKVTNIAQFIVHIFEQVSVLINVLLIIFLATILLKFIIKNFSVRGEGRRGKGTC